MTRGRRSAIRRLAAFLGVVLAVRAFAGPAPLGRTPLVGNSALHQRTLPFGFGGSPPELAINGRSLVLYDENATHVQVFPVDSATLKVGRPGKMWPEAPRGQSDSVRLWAAPGGAGWVIAKEQMGSWPTLSFFTTDASGAVTKTAPPGESALPTKVPTGGMSYPGGEHLGDVLPRCLAAGDPGAPLLLGLLLQGRARWKDHDGQLAFAFVSPDGHVAAKPVAAGWFIPAGYPMAAVPVPGGFLVAQHVEPFTGNAYDHGPETIQLLHVFADGSATVTDAWEVPKPNHVYSAVNRLNVAREGDEVAVVYGGPWGVFTVQAGVDGRRRGEPRPLLLPVRPDGIETLQAELMAAELRRGRVRVLVNNPVTLIELASEPSARPRTLARFRRDASTWSVALRDGEAWVVWSRGDWPPPYLTHLWP